MHKLINFLLFQIGWFAAVLGAAHGAPWLGVVVVPLVLGLHLALSPDWRPELAIAAGAASLAPLAADTLAECHERMGLAPRRGPAAGSR